jgi:hypothetical protein
MNTVEIAESQHRMPPAQRPGLVRIVRNLHASGISTQEERAGLKPARQPVACDDQASSNSIASPSYANSTPAGSRAQVAA